MEGLLLMNHKERTCLKVFQQVKDHKLNIRQASDILHLSYRHCRRKYQRFLKLGDQGLIHLARGKPSNRAISASGKQQMIALYKERFSDFGPTLASEKLALLDLHIDHETLRRLLIKEGLWSKRRRRAPHRSWRERRSHFGELVQFDGSHHHWFEQRGVKCCLMNMVDDSTGTTLSLFAEEETTVAAMRLLWQWIEQYGIPAALYTDRKSVYVVEDQSLDQSRRPLTQFGRACKELGILLITAHSPQAKGRVERSNSVYQDRLVKELRLAGINDIALGNRFLSSGFIKELNEKFAVSPRQEADYHRSCEGYDLRAVFSIEQEREVSKDWIVRYENGYYRLKGQSQYGPTEGRVKVKEYLDSTLHILYRDKEISYEKLERRPVREATKNRKRQEAAGKKKHRPGAEHPWRKAWSRKQLPALPPPVE